MLYTNLYVHDQIFGSFPKRVIAVLRTPVSVASWPAININVTAYKKKQWYSTMAQICCSARIWVEDQATDNLLCYEFS